MNKGQFALSLLTLSLLAFCVWEVRSVGDKLDRKRRGTGQKIEDVHGVTTERMFTAEGEPESLEAWAQRHREAMAMFEGGE